MLRALLQKDYPRLPPSIGLIIMNTAVAAAGECRLAPVRYRGAYREERPSAKYYRKVWGKYAQAAIGVATGAVRASGNGRSRILGE